MSRSGLVPGSLPGHVCPGLTMPVTQLEFGEEAGDVGLDGRVAECQLGDLGVAQAAGQVVSIADPVIRFHQTITLPRLQIFQRRGRAAEG